jgi:hypothetical protein
VFDGPQPCPDCGHDTSATPTHNVRACAACDAAAQVGQYAPCQTVAHIPEGAVIDDDPEALAAELVTEYAAAIERVRDRAQEARAGGRYLVRHPIAGALAGRRDLAELVRRDRRDAYQRLAAIEAAAEAAAGPIRLTPIGRAGLAAL